MNKEMTENQKIYAEMDAKFASEIKPFLDEFKAVRDVVVAESGLDAFFQGPDGVVYHTATKKGQWVDFTPHEIQRTRRAGETKGSLSLKAAKEAGFELTESD